MRIFIFQPRGPLMFPGLMAVKFNLFALLVAGGEGEQELLRPLCRSGQQTVPGAGREPRATMVGGQGCTRPKLVLLPTWVFTDCLLKPVAGCNPPPAISIYYDYFAFITSGAASQRCTPSEIICKFLCIAFPTLGGEGLYKQFAVNIQSPGPGRRCHPCRSRTSATWPRGCSPAG